jgi:spore germination cell wall hydrolase CwlJ-like protein
MQILNNTPKMIFLGILTLLCLFGTPTMHVSSIETSSVTRVSISKIDAKQLACMAKNIYHEAGHESIAGQAAVARVVLNRVRHGFGNNPCQVVYQKTTSQDKIICQFSWVCEGKGAPVNNYRYRQAQQVAYDVMVNNRYSDIIPNSTLFFHNTSVDPVWPYNYVATIGNHVFYSKAKSITPHKKPKPNKLK